MSRRYNLERRIKIMELLQEGCQVGEIMGKLGLGRPLVNQYIATLKRDGYIAHRSAYEVTRIGKTYLDECRIMVGKNDGAEGYTV